MNTRPPPLLLCCHKAEATDRQAAETNESIVLFTMQARFQVSRRSDAACCLIIIPFIVLHFESIQVSMPTELSVCRHDRDVDGMLYTSNMAVKLPEVRWISDGDSDVPFMS